MSESFRCTKCDSPTTVIDSRGRTNRGAAQMIRRRRRCNKCHARLTTYESSFDSTRFEEILNMMERRLRDSNTENSRMLLDLAEIRSRFQKEFSHVQD